MKILLITTDPSLLKWRTLNKKKTAILNALNKAKNANFTLDIIYQDVKPKIVGKRISHSWFDKFTQPYILKEYYFVGLHMSNKQWSDFGIDKAYNGFNQNDADDMGDFYIRADENTRRGRFNQFIETVLHEIRHELCKGTNTVDDTHDLASTNKSLQDSFSRFDMRLYRPLHQAKYSLLRKALVGIINVLQRQIRPKYELPVPYTVVTQPYGVPNSLYKMTGHHIGLDLRAPLGTPVKAPCDGELIGAGTTKQLGNFLIYKMIEGYLVMPHLASVPVMKKYKQGEVMATIGSTGLQTGVHAHIEIWRNLPDRTKLNAHTWDMLTTDPLAFFDLV